MPPTSEVSYSHEWIAFHGQVAPHADEGGYSVSHREKRRRSADKSGSKVILEVRECAAASDFVFVSPARILHREVPYGEGARSNRLSIVG